jgi:hypothetical protein
MELAKRSKFGIRLLGSSVILGIAGDFILHDETWGISLPIYAAFLIAQVLGLARISERKPSTTTLGLLAAAFVFSLTFLWRNAPELKYLNALAVFLLVGLAALHATGQRLTTAPITNFAVKALTLWGVFIADFFSLFCTDIKWAETVKQKGLAGTNAVARGILIAAPLLLVFGTLLVNADAAFQKFFQQFGGLDADAVWINTSVTVTCAVITGGFLRHLFLKTEKPPVEPVYRPFVLAPGYHPAYRSADQGRLGATELGIVLGSLNLLFGLFVLVQAPYLFGGAKHVLATEHLSYAEYARRGFFELVTVVALAIPVLLGSHALIKPDSPVSERIWRAMSILMVCLLGIVMNSAVDRMRLYVGLYSLTTERIYVLASLGWMGMVLMWFLITTVRGRSERFAFGAFASLLATILVVNILNPDALIVRYNVAQASPGKTIDGQYLRTLSADAIPDLIRNSSKLDPVLFAELASDWLSEEKTWGSWRSWTASRQAAEDALSSRRTDLTARANMVGVPLEAAAVALGE